MKIINQDIPQSMHEMMDVVSNKFGNESKISQMFNKGFINTYQTTIMPQEEGTTFVITGDIPAMWNRDSAAQVRPLLHLVSDDNDIRNIVRGVIEVHKRQVCLDPYANAHNLQPREGEHSGDDLTTMDPLVWERKYEVDSLCYPIQLAYLYWKKSTDTSIFDDKFLTMAKVIVNTFIVEQNHHDNSPYSFRRIADWLLFGEPERIEFETLPNRGMGREASYTGMTWSGFRPSDDACKYGYLVPSNMFAVVVLKYLEEIINKFYSGEKAFCKEIIKLQTEIDNGIKDHAIIDHPKYGLIYAYEVDGLGNYHLMDDANVPSLLAAPYLGYCDVDDPIYINTRKFLLSSDNPYFYEGKAGKGIGSPHTPKNYFWHISLAIEGMTTNDADEILRILKQFETTDANTGYMHEGIDVDNPANFTRPWFSWANAMYAEFILKQCKISINHKGE